MDNLQQPSVLAMPFANNGDKNVIPSAPTGTNKASLSEGFPQVTSESIAEGGIPPERADFNALGNIATMFYYFMQCGGAYTFRADVSSAIGGYPKGALLWYIPATGIPNLVSSTINNNTNNFNTDQSVIGEAGSGKPWEIVTISPYNYQLKATAVSHTALTAVGSGINPVFVAANGTATASTSTVGSQNIPVYLNNGTLTEVTTENVHVITETFKSGYSWYRIYDDGWVEQGGITTPSSTATKSIILLKEFADTSYTVLLSPSYTTTATFTSLLKTSTKSPTSFEIIDSTNASVYTYWYACGYGE